MPVSAVTVSRYLGAGAEEFSREVANRLGFAYVDEQIITRVAERANVTPELAMQAEQRQSLVDRILSALPAQAIEVGGQAWAIPSRREFEELIRDVVRETAQRGRVVLVAHGAAHAVGPRPGVLRVLLTGSEEQRTKRMMADGLAPDEARQAVERSQVERADYLRRFYDVTESPDQYDLCINTDQIAPAKAADIAISVAEGLS
jgi:cytidylate kinase